MKNPGVTWRSVLIGALLIPPNAYWIVQLELVWGGTYPSVITLLFNVIFSLFVVIGLNLLFGRFFPDKALSYGEVLTIYIMMAVGIALCGCDVMQTLVHIVSSPFWFATPENEWAELFHSHLPKYFTMSDRAVFKGFFEGESTLWRTDYLKAWLPTIAVWMGFVLALLFTMLCINTILRKQWVERERLTYPIVRLPREMARGGGATGVLKNKTMWIGFTVAAGTNIINGLNFLYPAIPRIPVKHQWLFRFTEMPWNAVGWFPVSFYPFVLGIGFLMPLDLSFSCWFFYLVWKAELVMGRAMGWSMQGYPFAPEQATGVWIGIFIFTMWVGRNHFKRVIAIALGKGRKDESDENEPMSYRSAILGILVGTGVIIIFCTQMGMTAWMALAYFAIYFALGSMIARIRAELGPPVHDLYGVGPDLVITRITGTRWLGERNLAGLSLLYWLNRESYRSFPMAHQMEGMKLAEAGAIRQRRLPLAIMIAGFVGGVSCFWVVLQFGYKVGSEVRFGGPARWFATEGFRFLSNRITYPQGMDLRGLGFSAFGLVSSLTLLFMRMRLLWWPLHPIGYAISYWWAMNLLWFPILLSFTAKSIILRYGGLSMYRRSVPFFLGLILGEYFIGGIWNLLGIALGTRMYAFWI
ncbi:DUF6785 family protein [Candidatus Poribacteria bacterium]